MLAEPADLRSTRLHDYAQELRHSRQGRSSSDRLAVDQDHAVPLSAECAAGLRAAVVELGRLADVDAPEPSIRMLCMPVRLGIYRYSETSACASAGPSAYLSRRAGAGCRSGYRAGREYRTIRGVRKDEFVSRLEAIYLHLQPKPFSTSREIS
jgi:hypothetical protein